MSATAAGVIKAVSLAADLMTAAAELTIKAKQVNQLVVKAQHEGRDVTDEELKIAAGLDDRARAALEDAIKRAS